MMRNLNYSDRLVSGFSISARIGRWACPLFTLFAIALGWVPMASAEELLKIESVLPENPFEGGQLFISKGCIDCHAISDQGGEGGPDLGKAHLKGGFIEIAADMWNHSPRMNQMFESMESDRPDLTPEEIGKIISFVYFLNFLDQPGDPIAGARLFQRMHCAECHSVGDEGTRKVKSLDRFAHYKSPVYLTTALWNKGKKMARRMRSNGIDPPKFEGTEINDIIAFIKLKGQPGSVMANPQLKPGNPINGQALFQSKGCVKCHAIGGKGWKVGPDLGDPKIHGSVTTIAGFQWNHGPGMWAEMEEIGMEVPHFSPQEMTDVITYLYYSQYISDRGEIAQGKAMFEEKGCASCHTEDGDAPTVDQMDRFLSPSHVLSAMWNHAAEMEKVTLERNIVWPSLDGREMAHVVAYLRSMQH